MDRFYFSPSFSPSAKFKVTGYNDFNFDGLNDFSGGPCNGGSGGGGCVENEPHPQSGNYELAIKMYQDYLPTPSSVSRSANIVGDKTAFTANNINQEMSFSSIDVSNIASLYSNDLPSQKVSSNNTDDDALPAEAVPEPTTGLGAFLALGGLGILKKLKNRKTQK
ncbi:MAG: PEP-CTERM sorting domain-containing protein [Microcoleus sp. PH2017_37_MFU_D_B]|uniref:PEP-CTERM sorting domain-containing protein n=1 Tax=Microcoleus sp. PH2017_37_MFU_D_B TaxID=2798847 RepID=UPI001DAF28DE|nr:PEP-CTERM sorting domain-containing protein [Microcoleus sp. PH2017_37_MFU_D_B]MCC3638994.1 PEP-CTERM sorting domain-containing protein [Microcoleus sp. PH2017_37_MFU_D_B]